MVLCCVVILLREMLSLILECKSKNMSWDKSSLTDIITYDIACDKTVVVYSIAL